MLHNIRLIQRRMSAKSNASLLPFVVASVSILLLGIMLLSAR